MNIVKGVADLLRRSSGGQAGESSPWGRGDRFSAPSTRIHFGDAGDEAVLNSLWQKYERCIDKIERRKLLHIFLMKFIQMYENWEPEKDFPLEIYAHEHRNEFPEDIIGCSDGHPSEVILILIQELNGLTSVVAEVNSDPADQSGDPDSANFNVEVLHILSCLEIITRSVHNCRVFSYYGGVQKIVALLKAVVVQLKTLLSAFGGDEHLSNFAEEKATVLQKMLLYVISIIFSFTNLNLNAYGRTLYINKIQKYFMVGGDLEGPPINLKEFMSEDSVHWQQKAAVMVLEAGGLNWLVELLRVIRRLNLKERGTVLSLQYLTLDTLRSALQQNPRAQNHFRLIGGLEVLLDGLGLPSSNCLTSKTEFLSHFKTSGSLMFSIFQLQILSLEVLRESTFGNMNNLQFLRETGRVQKFANSLCWPAFLFQEFRQWMMEPGAEGNQGEVHSEEYVSLDENCSFQSEWNFYVMKLSRALCSFLLPPEDIKFDDTIISSSQTSMPVSLVYCEDSSRWMVKVLFDVFPCIKACSIGNEMPYHLSIFTLTLQKHILYVFRKLLVSAQGLLDAFREEGIWDLIFSENFFYFAAISEEASRAKLDHSSKSSSSMEGQDNLDIFHMEVISFVEFTATLNGNKHNLPECGSLLDALEQSVCNPQISIILLRSLLRILQLAFEQTILSFNALDAVCRILKVACIEAEEHGKLLRLSAEDELENKSAAAVTERRLMNCMEASLELFSEYLLSADDGKSLVIQNAPCIECLFNLFWVENLRNYVLVHILSLLKTKSSSADDRAGMLLLCSKYLETFTRAKEREQGFVELSIDLLLGLRNVILTDQNYYQTLFCEGECFLHIVSLLNDSINEENGEQLVLNVLETLTSLLSGNVVSKLVFKNLVGVGYQMLQSLLLDFFQFHPSKNLLNALLDMLVDGKFDDKEIQKIKNEDVVILVFNILRKSSDSLKRYGLGIFKKLLRDSVPNRTSCCRAGILSLLLDWFLCEEDDGMITMIAQLIQVTGGHSVTGKDLRKFFALLRNEKIQSKRDYYTLLLTCLEAMLREKGPTAFFEFNGFDSGILIKTPVQWSYSKGFSFTCWIRVETFPNGNMGLFCFLSNNGRGFSATLGRDKLMFESINQKKQSISLPITIFSKRWHFLCITHSIGRTFSGGSILRCYIDGILSSSDKCSYPRPSENLTCCTIGMKPAVQLEDNSQLPIEESYPFVGQMGPAYLFGDVLSPDQVKGIHFLGPNYMYSFAPNELSSNLNGKGYLDFKDGLPSKIVFGLNAQASDGRILFNALSSSDHVLNAKIFKAEVMDGTQICSRRMLQEIIYCVGGVSVFFPLLVQLGITEAASEEHYLSPVQNDKWDQMAANVLELITSVLDDNPANWQQMHLLSGFSILGFLFQSVSPRQLNMHTVLSLKRMLDVLKGSGKYDLVSDAISWIYFNSSILVLAEFNVQRELYMLLIHYFEDDPSLLMKICQFPCILDTIHHFYSENQDNSSSFVYRPHSHSSTKILSIGRLTSDEVHKIRLLLLSLAEMSLRKMISVKDVKALVSFFEKSLDLACIEDLLHMVIRLLSQKTLLSSFLEHVDFLGGCEIFINLLQRDSEQIRLLALHFLGELLVRLPLDKKGLKFFTISVGRPKSLPENERKEGSIRLQIILSQICERLFKFPLSDNLSATLFDVLLGGASPKQILQKRGQVQLTKAEISYPSSHFILPPILALIFKFLACCKDPVARQKILSDLIDLLDSNPSNVEALMEIGWNSWLETSVKLYASETFGKDGNENEQTLLRSVFCIVLSHCTCSVRGGWHQLEETVNYVLLSFKNGKLPNHLLLQHIFEDLMASLSEATHKENIMLTQPCRDNTLYLLKLLDEMLINDNDDKLLFPVGGFCTIIPFSSHETGNQRDISVDIEEILKAEGVGQIPRIAWNKGASSGAIGINDHSDQWNLYDNIWTIVGKLTWKPSNKMLMRSPAPGGPSLGQRALGLVESLNIPATEMAAAVSGGIGGAFGGRTSKPPDKAMLLRSEKCPRIIFHLVLLYLCRGSLEKRTAAVQQFCALLQNLLSYEEEQVKSRFQLFLWSLLNLRSLLAEMDDEPRACSTTNLITEIINCWKSVLSVSTPAVDDTLSALINLKEPTSVLSLLQKDRVLGEATDEITYVKVSNSERSKQLEDLRVKLGEILLAESSQSKILEDEVVMSMSRILASDDSRRAAIQLKYEEKQQLTAERWVHMLRSLIDERGPWSANPFPRDSVAWWKLDKTEDNLRRRPKLKRNYYYDETLCLPSASNLLQPTSPVAESFTLTGVVNLPIPDQMKSFVRKEMYGNIAEERAETGDDASEVGHMGESEIINERNHLNSIQDVTDSETSEVLLSIPCVLVMPKRKLAGHLAVMQNALHFFSEFLIEGTGGSSIFKHFDRSNVSDSSKQEQSDGNCKHKIHKGIPNLNLDSGKDLSTGATDLGSILQSQCRKIKRHRRWNICKVKAVHWSRYLLQYTALEIFFNDSIPPVFFNFASSNDAKEVGTLIVSSRNEILFPKGSSRDKNGLISIIDRRTAAEMAAASRESWRRREISNFEYLMIINTLAGRSYNDLTQYPIFPWVLADYSSEKLNFNKSSTFRDLSKPIGALDLKRFHVFEERYHNFSDPDIPSFYYGSHYSSMGIVLFYLLRLEPFTSLHRTLQGGKFDHADRLFQSIEGTYQNCLSNTSDVKELIPEFFYMPEFLVNSNRYHLGVKQDGEPLNDVLLPPWAKGSPEEFIFQHREALESEYVSSNLHHWIDLIFGYKQRGKPAVEAANVFYYLTYEGAVDLETMDDELQRCAIEDQIANFGQTPIQLFRKKHPRRGPPIPIAHPLYFAPASISLTSIVSHSSQLQSPVLFLDVVDSTIVLVNEGLVLSVKTWLTTQLQSGGNFTFSSAQEPAFGIGGDVLSPRQIGTPMAENFQSGRQCFATVQAQSENYLISTGSWDNSFQVISLQDGRTVQSVRQHKDVVSCVSVSSDGSVLATGSYDTTVMLWKVSPGRANERRAWAQQTESSRRDQVIDESPFHILCGHDDIVTCLFVSTELDIVVSGSNDATCIFHTLRQGRYVRSIQHPSGCSLSRIVASGRGRVVMYAEDDLSLHLYSINGQRLASAESYGRLNCIELSGCGEFLVCAGDHGQITLRSMHSLEIVHRYEGIGKALTSLAVTPEECFLAGTRDGSLLVYSVENLQFRRNSSPKEIK